MSQGSIPGLEDIIEQYQKKIYWLALSIVHNEKDAQDVVQNTLLKLYRKLDTFRNKSQIATWIYRVSYNEALMYLRKKRRQAGSLLAFRQYTSRAAPSLGVNWSRLPDRELLDSEFRQRLDGAIKQIPIEYRMPLLLHRMHDLPIKDCSTVLRLNPATVKTRLHRAYLFVKQELDNYFKDYEEKQTVSDRRCSLSQGFIHAYVREELKPKRGSSFKKHIRDCASCKSFLNTYKQAIRITDALECQDIPSQLQDKIQGFLFNKKH